MNLYLLFVFYFDCSFFGDSRYDPFIHFKWISVILLEFVVFFVRSFRYTDDTHIYKYVYYMHILWQLKFVQPNDWLRNAIERFFIVIEGSLQMTTIAGSMSELKTIRLSAAAAAFYSFLVDFFLYFDENTLYMPLWLR